MPRLATLAQATRIDVLQDLYYAGSDPEMADMGNPRGEIYRPCTAIIAEAPDGSRWVHEHAWFEWDCLERARRFAAHVQGAVDAGLQLNPARWAPMRPCYGSAAYVEQGIEEEDRQREFDDDNVPWYARH